MKPLGTWTFRGFFVYRHIKYPILMCFGEDALLKLMVALKRAFFSGQDAQKVIRFWLTKYYGVIL